MKDVSENGKMNFLFETTLERLSGRVYVSITQLTRSFRIYRCISFAGRSFVWTDVAKLPSSTYKVYFSNE